MGRKNEDIGNRVTLCQDGKYRWVYEVNMLTNYSILFDVWKVFGITIVILVILFSIIFLFTGELTIDTIIGMGKGTVCAAGVLSVLSVIGYLFYAAISGWKYVVLFIMDEKEVTHRLSVLCCNIRMEICSAFHYGRERSDTSADAAFGKERSNNRSIDSTCRFGIRTARSGGHRNPFSVTQFYDIDAC